VSRQCCQPQHIRRQPLNAALFPGPGSTTTAHVHRRQMARGPRRADADGMDRGCYAPIGPAAATPPGHYRRGHLNRWPPTSATLVAKLHPTLSGGCAYRHTEEPSAPTRPVTTPAAKKLTRLRQAYSVPRVTRARSAFPPVRVPAHPPANISRSASALNVRAGLLPALHADPPPCAGRGIATTCQPSYYRTCPRNRFQVFD